MKLIDWVHYQVLYDELENHRNQLACELYYVWLHILRVLAMTCPNCLYWEEVEQRFCECEEE